MVAVIIFVIIAIFVIVAIFFVKAKEQSDDDNEVWPFYARKPLSQPELILYHRLVKALPEHVILAQVQLSRLIGVKKGNNYQSWINRINRMSVDFVVCNRDSGIVAVIELDDSTHQREDRRAADAKKDRALASADVCVIRWQAKAIPGIPAIQSAFMSLSN